MEITRSSGRSTSSSLIDNVANLLMKQSLVDTPIEKIFGDTCKQLYAAGVAITRAQIGFRVLHPLFSSQTLTWKLGEEVEPNNYINHRDVGPWVRSPLYHLVANNIPHLRRHLVGEDAILDFEILHEFKEQGYTDYFAFVVPFIEIDDSKRLDEVVENSGMVGS